MGPFKKYVTCIMAFFTPMTSVRLFQFYSMTSPVFFSTKNNKLWDERKEDFLYIWLLQRIMLYHTRKKTTSLDNIAFLDAHVYINNLY